MKIIQSLLLASVQLLGSEQLLVVLTDELNSTQGMLQRYEKSGFWNPYGEKIPVVLGRSGLGWEEQEPRKMEGDGRSPAGVFSIDALFGVSAESNSTLPYYFADENLICVDDSDDLRYNQMAKADPSAMPKSFEMMRRSDEVYLQGALIGYNRKGEKGRGSCIFLHANHPDRRPTAGCTAMDAEPLKDVLQWLQSDKEPILLQIPKSECKTFEKRFRGIDCN